MINKSNDLPSFVNENNLPKIVDKLSNASNIKITGNKYGNRVQTVIDKIVEKADDVTKAIKQEVINDSYSFKVGTGDVDVSADVEDGFGEVGIKGTTYQNVLPVGIFDSKENFYALGGEVSNLYSSFDGGYITLNATGDYVNAFVKLEKTLLKQNSKYTLILDIKNTNLTLKEETDSTNSSFAVASAHPSEAFVDWCFLGGNAYPLKNGIQKFLLTTKSDFAGVNWSTRMFISNNVASGSITFRYLLLEGDHTNNPNLPSYFEGIVGVGDKSKNLFREYHDLIEVKSGQKLYLSSAETTNGERIGIKCFATDKVTMDLDIISPNGFYKQSNRWLLANNQNKLSYAITVNKDGFIAFDDFLTTSQSYKRFNDIQLQEGSTATAYEPYYDGHKIEILSSNKNLLNWKEEEFIPVGGSSSYGIASKDRLGVCFDCNGLTNKGYGVQTNRQFTLKPNTKYTLGCEWDILRGTTSLTKPFSRVYFPNTNAYIGSRENGYVTFTTDYTGAVVLMFYIDTPSKSDIKVRFKNMFLYEGETNSYIENNQDKTQILLDEPLMRLPNGVHDEITRDGKLIKRVGKVVFDGSENFSMATSDTREHFFIQLENLNGKGGHGQTLLCDRFCSYYTGWTSGGLPSVTTSNTYYLQIGFTFELNTYGDKTKFKQWLQANPTTVYYELAEPIITELPAPYLRMFKDGHLTFNTLVAPESSHVIQLNKSAQIERSIREVQGLDNRINVLENNYDNLMLSTISRLNDLELDYTLK